MTWLGPITIYSCTAFPMGFFPWSAWVESTEHRLDVFDLAIHILDGVGELGVFWTKHRIFLFRLQPFLGGFKFVQVNALKGPPVRISDISQFVLGLRTALQRDSAPLVLAPEARTAMPTSFL